MVLLDASDHNDVIEVFSMAITKLCPFAVELPVHYFRTITPIVTYLRQGYTYAQKMTFYKITQKTQITISSAPPSEFKQPCQKKNIFHLS